MSIANHFYNATTRKYIAIFGSIFNKLVITRDDNDGAEIQRMVVPISYGPYQKFLARITQDPTLTQKSAITLPRMSFEMLSMTYDGSRKIGSTQRFIPTSPETAEGKGLIYAPAPYNIEFNLYVMVKNAEDGVKIIEQILPFFKPEYTVSAKLIDGLNAFDVPIVLNSVNVDDMYEADFETRRSIMWTLGFTMKGYYFGPIRSKNVIKFMDIRLFQNLNATTPETVMNVQPGLTANGAPTTDITQTIPYEQIEIDDDWGVITIVRDYDEESD